jgi:hypothetical protein
MNAHRRPGWPLVLTVSTGVWTAALVLQSVAAYADSVRRGRPTALGAVLLQNAPLFLPWVPFTAVLYLVLSARRSPEAGPWRTARVATLGLALFYIPQIAYQVAMSLVLAGRPLGEFSAQLARWPASSWLIDFTLYVMTFSVVYALVALEVSLEQERRRQQLDAENLSLRLEVEGQRLQSLRAQLEPHFLFNALNAISGLVRGGHTALALTAMQQLSALLRYALWASARTWGTVGDELAFVRDYITLQQLRFGDRLTFTIVGDDEAARAADCPPLLLQPLIENAIRHDLECHERAGEICLMLLTSGERLRMEIVNSLGSGVSTNPGLGMGLPSTCSRVALLYGPLGRVTFGPGGGRFVVSIDIPRQAPEGVQ